MLKKKIQEDILQALKAKDANTSSVLRMALSAVNAKEKEKRYTIVKQKPDANEEDLIKESALSDEQIIDVFSSEIKKRKDAIVLYEKGNRQELADKEKEEIEILKKYLPEQLSEEALEKLVKESVAKTGASQTKDMGKVMADLMPSIKGKADTGQVSKMIKELLNK